jgi:hypothetical protein
MTNKEARERFEAWCRSETPKWPTDRLPNGDYSNEMTQRHWFDWIRSQPPCEHGAIGYCGFCEAAVAPKCKKHGNPWYCGHCGPVLSNTKLKDGHD